jgi:hypothetical protein
MKKLFVTVAIIAGIACTHTKDPTPPPASTSTSCGALGAPCSPEGASCSPTPVGTGWAHMLQCSGGTWHELEIAPLPPPQKP